ncbi:MAG: 3-isopropylmalate dehydratase [Pseudomonadota bacterium]|uniref:LeuD/DmdB family oxidoreductase small subunit n=1 Tax=unclassified Phenylobacterium TaxID=2640670 RepID=UPI0006F4A362|nr:MULTISPECIES: 3-isopropylmalate dehydratase [unclassified Phenylobacterium]KRB40181.1 3-isopropylmalate dehydratase [Phenylobacterium sp. Root700]MBT9469845.1 3-isopropylmalate dehydratase [Phenylobacterium sp.]
MGRAFLFGDNIDTDLLAPGYAMKLPPEELARHCLEAIDPSFAAVVRRGDVVVAGRNFGLGSSREQAAVSLKLLGVSAVLAVSFARIFYRNAINLGLPAIILPLACEIEAGDELSIDPEAGRVENLTQARGYDVAPIPSHLMAMIRDGGLMPHLKRRLSIRGAGVPE